MDSDYTTQGNFTNKITKSINMRNTILAILIALTMLNCQDTKGSYEDRVDNVMNFSYHYDGETYIYTMLEVDGELVLYSGAERIDFEYEMIGPTHNIIIDGNRIYVTKWGVILSIDDVSVSPDFSTVKIY